MGDSGASFIRNRSNDVAWSRRHDCHFWSPALDAVAFSTSAQCCHDGMAHIRVHSESSCIVVRKVGTELFDGAGPRRGREQPVEAASAVAGRFGPPLLELLVLELRSAGLVAEAQRDTVEAVVLPHVDDLGPPPGGTDHAPDAVAELMARGLCAIELQFAR